MSLFYRKKINFNFHHKTNKPVKDRTDLTLGLLMSYMMTEFEVLSHVTKTGEPPEGTAEKKMLFSMNHVQHTKLHVNPKEINSALCSVGIQYHT
jgi:hypothetical protein